MKKLKLILPLFLLFTACQHIELVTKDVPDRGNVDPEVTGILLELINKQESYEISGQDYDSTSLGTMITLGTPKGIQLKLRLTELGIPLVEALKASRDEAILQRLFELAEWSDRDEMRAEALVTVARFADPKDINYFDMALRDKEVGLQLAGVEALQVWSLPEGRDLLRRALGNQWSPLVRVMAAQALLSMGENEGLPVLEEGLKNQSWIIRALSARYLGDYAPGDYYEKLYARLVRETSNDFVIAELAVGSLKLLSRVDEKISYTPYEKGWGQGKEADYIIGEDNVVEMEPLVIVPPRLFIPKSVQISETINQKLITLIRNRLGSEMSNADKNDPNFGDLLKMLTPQGEALKSRYSTLSLLLAEGLAGSRDLSLRAELENFARNDSNPDVRATALISLAYARNQDDLGIVLPALSDPDPIIRFGAMEAIQVGRFEDAFPDLTQVAYNDPVPAFRVFAIQVLMSFGEDMARNLLVSQLDEKDWPARAMAVWYLGRYGQGSDYNYLRSKLTFEKNPFVQAEFALALRRLAPIE